MIQQIINDAKAMEAEAIRAEEDAQKAYEDFVKETNASVETKNKDIANKSEEKAKAEGDLVQANKEQGYCEQIRGKGEGRGRSCASKRREGSHFARIGATFELQCRVAPEL